jgi:hypothetical protein
VGPIGCTNVLPLCSKLFEPGLGLLLVGKAPYKCTESKMVSVDYHSIEEVNFIFGNLNYTVNFFLFLLSFIFGPDSIMKIDDRSSKIAEKGWVC